MSILGWIIGALAMYANSQSYQRFGSSKSGGDIKVSYTCIMIFGLFFSSIMVIAGMAALILFPEAAAEAPSEAFWATVFTTLPVGLRGLFVAALLSAVMSTVSADYLICGAVIVHDIIKSFFKPSLSDKGEVWGTRIVIWIVGLLIIICTYFWEDGISKAYYYCGGFQVAAFIVPLMLGLFYQKEDPCGRILELAAHHCGLRRMGIRSGNSLGHTCQCGLHHIQRHRICRCCQAYL